MAKHPPKAFPKTSAAPVSTEELRLRRTMDASPLTRAVTKTSLARIPAPSLAGLLAKVASVLPPGKAELRELFMAAVAARAPRRARATGDAVQLDDLLFLNVIGYANGELLPQVCQEDWWVSLQADSVLPGLGAALVGVAVGSTQNVSVILPPDFPVEKFQSGPAVISVQVKSAEEILIPEGEATSPEYLTALGFPETLDEALEVVVEEEEERRAAAQRREILLQLLAQLVARAPASIPDLAVETAIGHEWNEYQGRFLLAQSIPAEDRDLAARTWFQNPTLREHVRSQLHEALVIQAIVQEEKLNEFTESAFEEYVTSGALEMGMDPAKILGEIRVDPKMVKSLRERFAWKLAMDFLLDRATVEELPA